jgi:uncharacterized protein (UPF0335 family)
MLQPQPTRPQMAPLSPQPEPKSVKKEKPADPLDSPANQEHARAAHEGHNSAIAAALDLGGRMAVQLDRLDREIAALNERKAAIYRELRRRGYDLHAFRFIVRESHIDPLIRAARDRKRQVYAAIPMPSSRDDGDSK